MANYSDAARLLFAVFLMLCQTLRSLLDCRTADSDEQKQWAFWRADNSIGTFFLQNNPKELVQPQPYDLRLSISNYRLFTVKETVPSSGKPQTGLSKKLSSIGKSLSKTSI